MASAKIVTVRLRELTTEEVAFLAWYYVAAARKPYGEFGDWPDGLKMKSEWEDHTGQELPDDFLGQVVHIHDSQ